MRKVILFIISKRNLSELDILIGSVLSIISPGLFIIIISVFSGKATGLEWGQIIQTFGVVVLMMAFFSTLPLLVIGLPWILLMRHLNILCWLTVCIGATLVGMAYLLMIEFSIYRAILSDSSSLVRASYVGALTGLISGVSFCIGAKFYSRSTLLNKDTLADQASVAGAKDA